MGPAGAAAHLFSFGLDWLPFGRVEAAFVSGLNCTAMRCDAMADPETLGRNAGSVSQGSQ